MVACRVFQPKDQPSASTVNSIIDSSLPSSSVLGRVHTHNTHGSQEHRPRKPAPSVGVEAERNRKKDDKAKDKEVQSGRQKSVQNQVDRGAESKGAPASNQAAVKNNVKESQKKSTSNRDMSRSPRIASNQPSKESKNNDKNTKNAASFDSQAKPSQKPTRNQVYDGFSTLQVSTVRNFIYQDLVLASLQKSRGSLYSIAERRVPELIPVLGSQPAGDVSHKPGDRLPLLSARPAVTLAALKRAATSFAAW